MKRLDGILLILLPILLSGCTGYGTISKNLAKDGAIIRADVNSPWGRQLIVRVGETKNSVRVTADGEIIINENKPAATTKK